MAKQATIKSVSLHRDKPKKKRPGIHAKKKTARSKTSKNYKKLYTGQGH